MNDASFTCLTLFVNVGLSLVVHHATVDHNGFVRHSFRWENEISEWHLLEEGQVTVPVLAWEHYVLVDHKFPWLPTCPVIVLLL